MAVRKKEAGSLTGSKRFKEEKENSVGAKAKKLAESLGSELKPTEAISAATSAVTETASNLAQAANDIKQGVQAITGYAGYTQGHASTYILHLTNQPVESQ